MRILVTGGAGFIGSHLCDYLLSLGHEVMALDVLVPQVHGGQGLQWTRNGSIPVPDWPTYMDERVQMSICDVANRNEVLHTFEQFRPEMVVHLAAFVGVGQSWYEPSQYLYSGGAATAALMEVVLHYNARAEEKVRRVFVAGSMSCYGEGPVGMDEHPVGVPEDWEFSPQNPYALAKATGEQVALMLGRANGLDVVVGRFFNVLGSRQALTNPYTGVGAIFAARLLAGLPPVVFENGQQSRDFIHVSDVVRAIWTLLERGAPGKVYNVGTGVRTTLLSLAERLCALQGGGLAPVLPGVTRAGDIRHCFADASKLKALGWAPEMSLDDSVAELWQWVSQQAEADPRAFVRAFGELVGHKLVAGAGAEALVRLAGDVSVAVEADAPDGTEPEATSSQE